jgi:protein-disulfide isomerase
VVSEPPKRRKPPARRTANSSRIFYLVLALVAVAGIGALTYLSKRPAAQAVTQVDPTLPKVESNGYVMGSPTAPVEVIEFGDFECPVCARFAAITEPDVRARLIEPGIVRIRYIDYPLAMHRNTWPASRAAACADEQGKFWLMHDQLYATQDQWNGIATRNPDDVFKSLAKQLGLNQQQFDQCVDSKKYQAKIQAHESLALQRQAGGTPTFIIGGQMITSPLSYDEFKKLVDDALAKSGSPVQRPADSSATKGATKAVTKTPARP